MAGGEPVAYDLDIKEVVQVAAVEADKAFVHEILCILLGSLAVKSGKGSVVALDHDAGFDKLKQLVV